MINEILKYGYLGYRSWRKSVREKQERLVCGNCGQKWVVGNSFCPKCGDNEQIDIDLFQAIPNKKERQRQQLEQEELRKREKDAKIVAKRQKKEEAARVRQNEEYAKQRLAAGIQNTKLKKTPFCIKCNMFGSTDSNYCTSCGKLIAVLTPDERFGVLENWFKNKLSKSDIRSINTS